MRVYGEDALSGLPGTARFTWEALDAWFEEDERVFVHPRNPYTRVDALRSTRNVRIELEGVVLAESSAPVMVFETGLPTRYYLDRTDVDLARMEPSDTVTSCPYKGTTSAYWSVAIGDTTHTDLAWAYDFPTRQLLPDRRDGGLLQRAGGRDPRRRAADPPQHALQLTPPARLSGTGPP